jgi:general secretion pathway protein K
MVAGRARTERGVALLATLVSITLLTLLVMDLTEAASLSYRSAATQSNELRAHYLARSAVEMGAAVLGQDAQKLALNQAPYDSLNDLWAMAFPAVPLGSGVAAFRIVDEARKLDINLLIDPRSGAPDPLVLGILTRLFAFIGVSPDLIPAIIDWLDPDSVTTQGGAEADYYLGLKPPYAPRNGPIPTIGDLRMVRGVDTATFALLSRYLTAAPERQVNVNTAPPEVLAALTPALADNPSMVKEIVAARAVRPFQKVTDVLNLPGVGADQTLSRLITTQSNYFSISASATYAGSRKFITVVLRRMGDGTAMLSNWNEP